MENLQDSKVEMDSQTFVSNANEAIGDNQDLDGSSSKNQEDRKKSVIELWHQGNTNRWAFEKLEKERLKKLEKEGQTKNVKRIYKKSGQYSLVSQAKATPRLKSSRNKNPVKKFDPNAFLLKCSFATCDYETEKTLAMDWHMKLKHKICDKCQQRFSGLKCSCGILKYYQLVKCENCMKKFNTEADRDAHQKVCNVENLGQDSGADWNRGNRSNQYTHNLEVKFPFISKATDGSENAFCKFCKINLWANHGNLRIHQDSFKHKQNQNNFAWKKNLPNSTNTRIYQTGTYMYKKELENEFDFVSKALDGSENAYCKICKTNLFPSAKALRCHEESSKHINNEKDFDWDMIQSSCDICGMQFQSAVALTKHLITHMKPMFILVKKLVLLKCSFTRTCDYETETPLRMSWHMKTEHKINYKYSQRLSLQNSY